MKKFKTLSTNLITIIFLLLCMTFAVSAKEVIPENNIEYEIYTEIGVMIMWGEGEMKDDFFGLRKEDHWMPTVPPDYDVDVDDIVYPEELLKFFSVKTLIITEGITTIGAETFAAGDLGFKNLESVILPQSIKEIGDGAFYGCYKLKNINIPDGTIIGEHVFGLTAITALDYSENQNRCLVERMSNLKKLRSSTNEGYIAGCHSLEEVIIDTKDNNTDYQDSWKFWGCSNLKEIRILSLTDSFELDIIGCPNAKVICYQDARIIEMLEENKISYEIISPTVKTLDKVKNIKTKVVDSYFTVSWDPVKNASYYQVDVYDSKSKCYVTQYTGIKTTKNISTKYDATAKIRVRACCFDGDNYTYSEYTDYTSYYLGSTILKVTVTSDQAVTLSWDAVNKATGYQIYWSTDNKSFKKLATVKEKSYKVSGLENGKMYYFKLRAYKKLANGDYTYGSFWNTEPVFMSGLKASSTSKGKVTLTWYKITSFKRNSYTNEKYTYKYQIYYSTDGKNYKKFATTDKISYTKSGLTSGKTYYFKMQPVAYPKSGAGVKLSYSREIKIKIK